MIKPISLDIDAVPASPLPISLSSLKEHLLVDTTDHDALITKYLFAAVEAVENRTHRTVVRREHRWTLRDFPHTVRQEIHLPRGRTQSIASIAYVRNGSTVTLTGPSSGSPAGTDYQEDLSHRDGGVIMPPRGASWPSVDFDAPAPVTITFEAGWAVADIPADIIHAMMMIVGQWFAYREQTIIGNIAAVNVPGGADALLSSYDLSRFY